jgi:hypothetical protein
MRWTLYRIIDRSPVPSRWIRLGWLERLVDRQYRPLVQAASGEERQRIDSEWFFEASQIWQERESIRTHALLREATRFHLPTPSRPHDPFAESEDWEFGRDTGHWYLTKEGYQKVSEEIHKQQERNRVRFARRLGYVTSIVGALTGLGGVIIGLLAMCGRSSGFILQLFGQTWLRCGVQP